MRIFPRVKQEWRDERLIYWVKNCKYTRTRPNKGLGAYNQTDKTITLIIVPGEFFSVKTIALLHELMHHWQREFKLPSFIDRFLDSDMGYKLFGQFYNILSVFEYRLIDVPVDRIGGRR